MTAQLMPLMKMQFNQGGAPVAGGKVFTYFAGTTTKQTTYTDASAGTPNTNPIILDANGQCDIWANAGTTYKIVLSPSTDTDPPTNAYWTEDNVAITPNLAGTGTVTSVVAGNSLSGGTITAAGTISVTPITAGLVSSNGTILEATTLSGAVWSAGTLTITNQGSGVAAGLVSSNGTILEATTLGSNLAWSAGTLSLGASVTTQGNSVTGSGSTLVLSNSPTLTTPTLGVASASTLTLTGSLPGSSATGVVAYGTLSYADTGHIETMQANVNSFVQTTIQNTNAGANASADFIVANNSATATTNYGDFGINSSGFSGTGVLSAAGYVYLYSAYTDLVIGTLASNAIHFVGNNGTVDALTITNGNQVQIGGNTVTLGGTFSTAGAVTHAGAFPSTIRVTGTTDITVPTSGTLVNTGVTALTSLAQVGTITSGTWQGSVVGPTYGGTGVNNGSNTLTLAGNLATSGAFNTTLVQQVSGSFTLPLLASTTLAVQPTWTTFANSGTYTPKTTSTVIAYTLVGGGGQGGYGGSYAKASGGSGGGGGGAGGINFGIMQASSFGATSTVTVGAGGSGQGNSGTPAGAKGGITSITLAAGARYAGGGGGGGGGTVSATSGGGGSAANINAQATSGTTTGGAGTTFGVAGGTGVVGVTPSVTGVMISGASGGGTGSTGVATAGGSVAWGPTGGGSGGGFAAGTPAAGSGGGFANIDGSATQTSGGAATGAAGGNGTQTTYLTLGGGFPSTGGGGGGANGSGTGGNGGQGGLGSGGGGGGSGDSGGSFLGGTGGAGGNGYVAFLEW